MEQPQMATAVLGSVDATRPRTQQRQTRCDGLQEPAPRQVDGAHAFELFALSPFSLLWLPKLPLTAIFVLLNMPHHLNLHSLSRATEWLAQADGLLIAAGAGMGVDSGLPDFRGDQGLWRAYPALAHAGLRFVEIANPSSFDTDPRLAWGFYGHRLALYRRTRPHAGFELLLRLAERMEHGHAVNTSNVDGQFQAAGFPDEGVHECHGSIHFLQCTRPCTQAVWSASSLTPIIDEAQCRWLGELPKCPHCGALARPNILMFNDAKWISDRTDAQLARLGAWLGKTRHPVIIELGAGTHVPAVRNFSEHLVHTYGVKLIRINPRDEAVPSRSAIGLRVGALSGLQALVGAR